MGERLLIPVVCSVFLSVAAVGDAAADGSEAGRRSGGQILAAVQDGQGNHAVLVRAGESMAVLMGKPGKMASLDVASAHRSGPSFMVDTLQEGMIEFNTRDKTAIIRGDVGFIQRRPTRTFSNSPDKAVIDTIKTMMTPKPAANPAPSPPRGHKGERAREQARSSSLRSKSKAGARVKATNTTTAQRPARSSQTRGLTPDNRKGQSNAMQMSSRKPTRAIKAKSRSIKVRGR